MNSIDTPSATSSPALADGAAHCGLPNTPKTCACGQPLVLANLSARQAREAGLLTSGTYGPRSNGSYLSVGLSLFLANRLRARTDLSGSTLYRLTWKRRITPSQRSIYALRASAPRMCASGFIGRPTPLANDHKGGTMDRAVRSDGRDRGPSLPSAVLLVGWPTSLASDAIKGGRVTPRKNAMALPETAQLFNWQGAVRYTVAGETLTGSSAGMDSSGPLNPDHSRWQMGYPHVWQRCMVTAMQSFRKLPKASSETSLQRAPTCRNCGDDDEL